MRLKKIRGTFSCLLALAGAAGAQEALPAQARNPADRPLIAERIVFNWHNFLSGCSTWNFEDWQRWTAQSQRLGYSAIMVHAYGNNPMAGFTFEGKPKPVGYLSTTVKGRDWSTMHVNDVRRLVGGEVFDGPVFGSDAGMVPDEQRVQAAQALMSRVFADASQRGMGVCFAVDVDTPSANPQELVNVLPESARFKANTIWLPNPDTPQGYAYFLAQVGGLMKVYPQITRLVVWFRRGGTPWVELKVSDLPGAWQKEYAAEVARMPGAEKEWHSAGLFAIGKIVRAFERSLKECGAKQTQVAAGTWGFEFLRAADRFFPAGTPLIGLDYDVIHERPQLGDAAGRALLREVGTHRPVIPIIWAHHDDGHYIGRPYTPFSAFYSKLADSGAAGFGIIHWTTRPLDLYFSSHARQVFEDTKDEPLRATCDAFAAQTLGEPRLGEYLYRWVTEAPRFARDTSDYFIDRPLTNCAAVVAGCRERLTLLESEKGRHAEYYKGLERFIASFHETHDLFQRAQTALASNQVAKARQLMSPCRPEAVIEQFASFSSIGGMSRGEKGLVVSLNTRWLVYYVRLRQMLGLEPVRYNFGPTSHDPLAQSPGRFTYFFDSDRKVWQTLGTQETGAAMFSAPSVKEEVGQHGLVSDKAITLAVRPITHQAPLPAGDYRLRLLFTDPDSTAAGQRVFNVSVSRAGGAEQWSFDPVKACFLRLRCHGTSANEWNSLYEVRLDTLAKDGSPRVTASTAVKGCAAECAIDGDPATRWAANGPDHWLQFRLDGTAATERIALAWYMGDQRQAKFGLETSEDGQHWMPVRNLRRVPDDGAASGAVDVFKEAGGSNRLLERVFPITLRRAGEITVTLTPVKGKAVVSGMVLEPNPYPGTHIGKSLGSHLQVLNYWEKLPVSAEKRYEAAFRILEARKDASFADVAADAEFQSLCEKTGSTLLGGPMLGALSATGARVWVRTSRPAPVEVVLAVGGKEKRFGPVASLPETDLTAVVEIAGLTPATRTPYQVWVDGRPVAMPAQAAITTPSEKPAETRIAFGSCFHSRLGNPKLSQTLLSRKPAACLLLGDIAADDKRAHLGLARADYLMRDSLPAWQRLVAEVPVYAVWDDHDYFDNDASGIPKGHTQRDMESVWEVFRRAWNNPAYGFCDERRGLFFRTRIGICDVVMLDTRYLRSGKPGQKDAFLGAGQMRWLEEQLLDCKGPFILLSSGTMWSDYVSNGKDSWGVWDPQGREAVFALIEKNRIGGVLLLSGDRHGARGFRIPRPSGHHFYEFEAASLGGWSGPGEGPGGSSQLYGVLDTVAFGEFTFDPAPADPEAVFRLLDESGETLYQLKLTRSQLTPPPRAAGD